jgi:hypothetical protein
MIRACHIIAVMLVLLIVLPGTSRGVDNNWSRETLRGIKGVFLLVEVVEPEIESAGLTRGQIKADVELKLRMAGLNVLNPEEATKTPGRPWLALYPNIQITNGGYVYATMLNFYQDISLVRNNKRSIASTWSTASYGTTGSLANIRGKIKGLVDEFLSAWRSVNPK